MYTGVTSCCTDTIRTVEGYADCIVLRHFLAGSARKAARAASVPILNAGDGPGQHPTQALIDVYTIQREIGRLDDISIGLVGDLANGRTVRSLAYVLSMYKNVRMYFVSPDVVRMKDDIKEYLSGVGVCWEEVDDLKVRGVMQGIASSLPRLARARRRVRPPTSSRLLARAQAVASEVDVLYQTRIQKERFQDRPEDYEAAKGKYIVDAALMQLLKKDAVVMHPLPRVDEVRRRTARGWVHEGPGGRTQGYRPGLPGNLPWDSCKRPFGCHHLHTHAPPCNQPPSRRSSPKWTRTRGRATSARPRMGCLCGWRSSSSACRTACDESRDATPTHQCENTLFSSSG